MQRTPLHERHVALGARFTDFGGWEMPVRYGSHHRRAPRGAHGGRPVRPLAHGRAVGERPGRRPRAWPRPSSRDPRPARRRPRPVLAHLRPGRRRHRRPHRVPHRRRSGSWSCPTPRNAARSSRPSCASRLAGLDAALDDATLTDRPRGRPGAACAGRSSGPLTDVDLGALRSYAACARHAWRASPRWSPAPAIPARTASSCSSPGTTARRLGCPARRGTRARGLLPCGLGARDTLRLEAGMPLYGNELDRDTTPVRGGPGPLRESTRGPARRDFVGRAALEARGWAAATPAGRPRPARAGHRPPRLPGLDACPGTPDAHRHRHERQPVARRWAWPSPWPTSRRPPPSTGTMLDVGDPRRRSPPRSCALPFYRRTR